MLFINRGDGIKATLVKLNRKVKESASLIDKGRLRGENVVFILRWTTRQTGKEVVG
jgi:hypothetical protein